MWNRHRSANRTERGINEEDIRAALNYAANLLEEETAQAATTLSALEDVSVEHTLALLEPGRIRFRRPL
jgi:phenylalanyl-tRNA synthetase beta subunit